MARPVLRGALAGAAALAVVVLLAPGATGATGTPWRAAAEVRSALADAQKALILAGPARSAARVAEALKAYETGLAGELRAEAEGAAPAVVAGLRAARAAAEAGDTTALETARGQVWTAILGGAYRAVVAAVAAGEVDQARTWLLVREFRPPTRFSRPGADATLALRALAEGRLRPADALDRVRADLLDTYQGRFQAELDAAAEARADGFGARLAGAAALAQGYFGILRPAYAKQRGEAAAELAATAFAVLEESARDGARPAVEAALARARHALEGFRAAPLAPEEQKRRAGQLERFLELVPVEYGRGISDGRVTKDFEIQEAITFRDGAAAAFADLEPALAKRDPVATRRIAALVTALGSDLADASRGRRVTDPDALEQRATTAVDLAVGLYPDEWKAAGSSADFDVIRATLDRLEGAVAAGQYGQAEAARLEAYAFFEFGPEQRLRGLAPDLFVRSEGLFWYGADGLPGLAQLLKRHAPPDEVGTTRKALDTALVDAETAVGAGPKSTFAVVSNTAIIVFREGLEAVLILAALMAGMRGAERRFRRPLLLGALAAGVATVATWAIAQTVLGSLNRYGEKLEAVVSLVAIAVLLLILNWFYHHVYWSEHLSGLHKRKRTLTRAGISVATAQLVGLAALGFSSVYREGFETTLFLQALVLEAGTPTVLEGVALGLAGTLAVGVATIVLQRKLPHKKMLVGTGLLITWVLVVMVGTTVQVLQSVGWLPVSPIEGLQLPYWAGLWFGIFPTWEGIGAQAGAAILVIGSYVLAEQLRRRKRRTILAAPARPPERAESRARA